MADLATIIAAADGAGIIRVPKGTLIGPTTISKPARFIFEPGNYNVSGSVTFDNLQGTIWEGSGVGERSTDGTKFNWVGNSADPMFNLVNSSSCVWRDFGIASGPAVPLSCAFQSPNLPPTVNGALSTRNSFKNIGINGTWTGGLGNGFRFGIGGGNNNDLHSFEDVVVENYGQAAWSFEGSQSKSHNFRHCTFNGNGIGQAGIRTGETTGGSFFAWGLSGGGNTVADFDIGAPDDCILISGGNFENSPRLLQTRGRSSNGFPITIEGVRWAGISLHPDGRAINYTQRGPLNLIGNTFSNDGTMKALELHLDPSGPACGTAIGNQVGSSLANPFTGNTWAKLGNVLWLPSGGSAPMANAIP